MYLGRNTRNVKKWLTLYKIIMVWSGICHIYEFTNVTKLVAFPLNMMYNIHCMFASGWILTEPRVWQKSQVRSFIAYSEVDNMGEGLSYLTHSLCICLVQSGFVLQWPCIIYSNLYTTGPKEKHTILSSVDESQEILITSNGSFWTLELLDSHNWLILTVQGSISSQVFNSTLLSAHSTLYCYIIILGCLLNQDMDWDSKWVPP